MPLHQLLRMVNTNVPIILFDLQQRRLQSIVNKNDINIDLYEEDVFQITCGPFNEHYNMYALYIMLRK